MVCLNLQVYNLQLLIQHIDYEIHQCIELWQGADLIGLLALR